MTGFIPDWPAPAGVGSFISDRSGGVSPAPYASNNLGLHVGDDPALVQENRRRVIAHLGLARQPQWLEQVHETDLVEARDDGEVRRADGCFSQQAGLACVVMTADCMPLLLCDVEATQVAAVHCGWRGLVGNIIHNAVRQFAEPGNLMAYLGPAISQAHYEVGAEVKDQLAASVQRDCVFALPSSRPNHYLVDLYAIARAQLHQLGVSAIYGGNHCTFAESEFFYSYRREPVTGRFASLIWLR